MSRPPVLLLGRSSSQLPRAAVVQATVSWESPQASRFVQRWTGVAFFPTGHDALATARGASVSFGGRTVTRELPSPLGSGEGACARSHLAVHSVPALALKLATNDERPRSQH